jgi:uncharacterized damage-inducible protein DinB
MVEMLKSVLKWQMEKARAVTEGMIAALSTPAEWTHQVHPKANHPLWVVGHLALADNFFLQAAAPTRGQMPDGWNGIFWFGTTPVADPSQYPAPDVVVAYFRERRETLLNVLEFMTDAELQAPMPAGFPFSKSPCIAQLFSHAAFHEGLHSGQFSVAHRDLGHSPLFQPPPAE